MLYRTGFYYSLYRNWTLERQKRQIATSIAMLVWGQPSWKREGFSSVFGRPTLVRFTPMLTKHWSQLYKISAPTLCSSYNPQQNPKNTIHRSSIEECQLKHLSSKFYRPSRSLKTLHGAWLSWHILRNQMCNTILSNVLCTSFYPIVYNSRHFTGNSHFFPNNRSSYCLPYK